MYIYIYIYIYTYQHISSVPPFCVRVRRPSDGRTSSPTTLSSRRAIVGHSVRCFGMVIYVCLLRMSCLLPVGVYMYTYVQIYTHAYTYLHMRRYVHADFFFIRLMNLPLCSWVVSLRRSWSRLRLRYLERRHVRHRDLQGEFMPIRTFFYIRFMYAKMMNEALRAHIRTSFVFLRRRTIICQASGWHPRHRLPRKSWRRGRAQSACMP